MTAHSQVAQIPHPELGLLVSGPCLPLFNRVCSQPTGRRAVAMLAAHAVADVEALRAHLGGNRQRMARQAFLVLVRR